MPSKAQRNQQRTTRRTDVPEIAKQITVKREGHTTQLVVDGQPFSWHIAAGVDVHVDRDDFPGVTLTLLADEVLVEDRQKPPPPPEIDWQLVATSDGAEITRLSTFQPVLENDIVTAPDGSLWKVEEVDRAAKRLCASPYEIRG
jgi:hypothetical protein